MKSFDRFMSGLSTAKQVAVGLIVGIMLLFGIHLLTSDEALAQAGRGFDIFGAVKTSLVITPTNIVNGGVQDITNFIDKIGRVGVANLLITSCTNSGNATNGCLVQSSPDQTNWTAVLYALATNSLGSTLTNTYYNQNGTGYLFGTNIDMLAVIPNTVNSNNIATLGFSGTPSYPTPISFTNTNWIALSTSNTAVSVGFNIDDAARYFRIIMQSYSNVSYSAMVISAKTGN